MIIIGKLQKKHVIRMPKCTYAYSNVGFFLAPVLILRKTTNGPFEKIRGNRSLLVKNTYVFLISCIFCKSATEFLPFVMKSIRSGRTVVIYPL